MSKKESQFSNITATATIKTGQGILVGMYVNSTSTGTIRFYDNTSAAGTVIHTVITPSVGYHDLGGANFSTGLHAVITSTLDVTLYYY